MANSDQLVSIDLGTRSPDRTPFECVGYDSVEYLYPTGLPVQSRLTEEGTSVSYMDEVMPVDEMVRCAVQNLLHPGPAATPPTIYRP